MSHLPIPLIEITRIPEQQGLHDFTQRSPFYLQKEVKVILHQRIGIKMEGVSGLVFGEICKEGLQIFVVEKYILPLISPRNDVIQSSWKMDPRFPSYSISISKRHTSVNTELPLPDPLSYISASSHPLIIISPRGV